MPKTHASPDKLKTYCGKPVVLRPIEQRNITSERESVTCRRCLDILAAQRKD